MKTKIIIALMAFFLCQHGRSQGMPVYDNTNFIALGKSIIESAKQTAQLIRTVRFLKEQKERIERVSSVVKQLQAVRETTRNNQILFDMVRSDLREILSSPYIKPHEIDRVSESFNSIIERSLADLDFMRQLLSSGHLKMTDGERLEILNQQKVRSREMVAEIQLKNKRYRNIISFREAQDKINNRETNY